MSQPLHIFSRGRPTHSQRLERYLGAARTLAMSEAMRDFYWPIPVHGVPGKVYAMPGGDFAGEIEGGQEMSAVDRALDIVARGRRRFKIAGVRARHRSYGELGAFASFNAIIAALTGGKGQQLVFQKTGVAAAAIGNACDLWGIAGVPGAGAAGGAPPGGTVPTNTTAGALGYANPVNANTGHHMAMSLTASVAANALLLYDRLMMVAKTMNSIAIEQVGAVLTRYQNATATAADYIGGNFCFPSNPTTVLAATAHNWVAGVTSSPNQGCCYTNQAGVEAGFQLGTGLSACPVRGVDLAAGNWFLGLAAGDVGVKKFNTMACSALVATGTIDFVVGHPIAMYPCPVANQVAIYDGLFTALNLTSIFDNACLAFLEMPKPAVTATTYSGVLTVVAE